MVIHCAIVYQYMSRLFVIIHLQCLYFFMHLVTNILALYMRIVTVTVKLTFIRKRDEHRMG
jgi:hypothetical protein